MEQIFVESIEKYKKKGSNLEIMSYGFLREKKRRARSP
jgi:hypothetical protein